VDVLAVGGMTYRSPVPLMRPARNAMPESWGSQTGLGIGFLVVRHDDLFGALWLGAGFVRLVAAFWPFRNHFAKPSL